MSATNSAIRQAAWLRVARQNDAPETVPAGGSHSQPMDIFPFHKNYTRQSQETVTLNSAVSIFYMETIHELLKICW